MFKEDNHLTIITGQPANGKTTVGRLLQESFGFVCIEGDDFITPIGKTRLNNGSWNDTDRKVYLSRMAASAVEIKQDNPDVVVVDCLTTRWMREFLVTQIHAINHSLAVGFILIDRQLTSENITQIAALRSAQGHALDVDALVRFRQAFEPWDPKLPCVSFTNPGDGNIHQLLMLAQIAITKLWSP